MIHSIYTHKEIFLREIFVQRLRRHRQAELPAHLTDERWACSRERFRHHLSARQGDAHPHRQRQRHRHEPERAGEQSGRHRLQRQPSSSGRSWRARTPRTPTLSASSAWASTLRSWWPTTSPSSPGSTVEEQAWRWESAGVDGYTIEPCEKETVGTDIIMHLQGRRRGAGGVQPVPARSTRCTRLVKKYSDYIRFPIRMEMTHSVPQGGQLRRQAGV